MNVGSLFAGIGGFDLAAQWVGWRTAWVSEIDPYASAVLRKRFPSAPNHGDIRGIQSGAVEPVDMLCGGFPCQDISLAGKGAGIGGERSSLWKEYARLIEEIRPRWVVAENVSALRSRGLDVVLKDLMALGYDAEWHCIPAAYVGAPHRRDRIWIVAYPIGAGLEERALFAGSAGTSTGTPEREDSFLGRAMADVSDPDHEEQPDVPINDVAWRSLPQSPRGHGWWFAEPDVGRVAHGIPSRVDRLRCLGNAVVPQVPLLLFQAINLYEQGLT